MQSSCRVLLPNLPKSHVMHSEAPTLDRVPTSHGRQTDRFAVWRQPAGQAVHADADPAPNSPAGQCWHAALPSSDCLPTAQGAQVVAFEFVAWVLVAHMRQVDWPCWSLKRPGAHGRHPACPGLFW